MMYELHPLCTLFPRMSGNEFLSLIADIKENGLREPIIIHEGMILDGGNRYRACIEAGIDPEFMEFGGANLVSYVLSANLHRRHMTAGQQAAIVASAQDWSKAQSVGNPQLRNVAQLETAADRAAQSGASHRTQQMADRVAKTNPELAKKVAHGDISLPKAHKSISTPKKKIQSEETEPEFDPNEYHLQELEETIKSLDEENTKLKDALASNQLPDDIEIQTSEEIISELRKQVKDLDAELSAVKAMRDSYMTKCNELEKQCKWQQGKLKKLEVVK